MRRQNNVMTKIRGLLGALFVTAVMSVLPVTEAAAACRGAWAEGNTYQAGDVVTYNSSTYTARSTHTACVGCGWNPVAAPSLWLQGGTCTTPTPSPTPTTTVRPTPTPTTTVRPTPTPTTTVRPTPTPTTTVRPTPTTTVRPTPTATVRPTPTPTPTTTGTPCWTPWVASTAYTGGAQVSRSNQNYQAAYWTQGDDPTTNNGPAGSGKPWIAKGPCGGATPTPTPTPTPTTTPTTTVRPTPTPTTTVRPTPTPTTTSTPTPSPTATLAPYKPRVTHVPKPSGYPTDAQMTEQEAAVVAQASATGGGMQRIRDALRVRPDSEVNAVVPGRAANPENVRRVEAIIPRAKFDFLFPMRHTSYTYENYLKAIAKFPSYCDTYTDGRNSDAICRKLLAVSFAHFTQETGANWPNATPTAVKGHQDYSTHNNAVLDTMPQNDLIPLWRQALWFLREVGYLEGGGRGAYQNCYNGSGTIFSIFYPCGQNASGQFLDYFGRGSKQLSWNYNYGPFSKALYGDVNVLLDNPARVADTWLNFSSAIWFAIMPRAPKPPMTWVVDGTWVPSSADISANMKPGLGATTFIINGGIECGKGTETQQSTNRINAYKEIARELGVPIPADEPLGCANMQGFPTGSSATTQTYLDKVWSGAYGCQLVAYETPFNIAAAGDYKQCVDYWFRGQVIYNGQVVINNAP